MPEEPPHLWFHFALGAASATAILTPILLSYLLLHRRKRRAAELAIQQRQDKAIRHRDALLELAHLAQTTPEEQALPRITEIVSRTLHASRVSVWRLDDPGTSLLCLDLFAGLTHTSGDHLAATDHPAYFQALHQQRLIVADNAPDNPLTHGFAHRYLPTHDIRSLLDVPLRLHGRAAGVLCIEHCGQPRAWDLEDQSFATTVADQLTLLREASVRLRAERALREAHSDLEIRVMLRTTQLAEARDRAEEADRIKSAFLATMSHELRTPLNSIIGFTGILLQGLVGPLNPEQEKQLGMVRNSARHLLSLINDVLDISKIEAGQVELSRRPTPVADLVSHAAALLTPLAQRKGLTLETTLAPDLGSLTTDPRRVEQILINLGNNAIKFTDHGSVHLHARRTQDAILVDVRDTGIGIPADQIPLLFRPFRQLDSGLSRHHEGTGLGLAICAGLVKLLGGAIHVQSNPGTGSTFTLQLPTASRPES